MSCFMFALYLLFLPPLPSGRPRARYCPCDRLRRRWHFFFFSRASRQAPALIIPISPIPFSHACIRFCYCYCLLLFWCIACFCNLLIVTLPAYPKLLSIGWLVIHQWCPPFPCCPCFIIEDPINGIKYQAPAPHITFPLVALHYWVTIECRGWDLISTSDVNLVV